MKLVIDNDLPDLLKQKKSIEYRIKRWHDHCLSKGRNLKVIRIHPDDISIAPALYKGIPVAPLGYEGILDAREAS